MTNEGKDFWYVAHEAALCNVKVVEHIAYANGAHWARAWVLAFVAMGEWARTFEYDNECCQVGSATMGDQEANDLLMNRPSGFAYWEKKEMCGFYMGRRVGEVVGAAIVAWGCALRENAPRTCIRCGGPSNMTLWGEPMCIPCYDARNR